MYVMNELQEFHQEMIMNQIQVMVKDYVNPRFRKPGRLRTGFPQNSDVLLLKWYCTLGFMNPGLTLNRGGLMGIERDITNINQARCLSVCEFWNETWHMFDDFDGSIVA